MKKKLFILAMAALLTATMSAQALELDAPEQISDNAEEIVALADADVSTYHPTYGDLITTRTLATTTSRRPIPQAELPFQSAVTFRQSTALMLTPTGLAMFSELPRPADFRAITSISMATRPQTQRLRLFSITTSRRKPLQQSGAGTDLTAPTGPAGIR